MYRYVPPASGIAVAISDCDSAAGSTTNPARKNARITDGPAISKASPGNTNIPDPIIAPIEIVRTAYRPSDRRRAAVGSGEWSESCIDNLRGS
jgi:hypothetical protein